VRDTTSGLFLFFLRVVKRNVTRETSLPQTKEIAAPASRLRSYKIVSQKMLNEQNTAQRS
jgi:hypothetical protein